MKEEYNMCIDIDNKKRTKKFSENSLSSFIYIRRETQYEKSSTFMYI